MSVTTYDILKLEIFFPLLHALLAVRGPVCAHERRLRACGFIFSYMWYG
jgi:hypothetical protein